MVDINNYFFSPLFTIERQRIWSKRVFTKSNGRFTKRTSKKRDVHTILVLSLSFRPVNQCES